MMVRSVRRFFNKKHIVKEEMIRRFSFMTTVTQRIDQILKTKFKFILSQMARTKSKCYNKFDPFLIMTVANRIRKWPYELKKISFNC